MEDSLAWQEIPESGAIDKFESKNIGDCQILGYASHTRVLSSPMRR